MNHFSQGSVATVRRLGGHVNNRCVANFFSRLYCVPNIIEIGQDLSKLRLCKDVYVFWHTM